MFSTNIYAKKIRKEMLNTATGAPEKERWSLDGVLWWPAPEQHLEIWQCGTEIPKKNVFKGHVQLCGLFFVDIARQNKVNVEIPTSPPTEAFN